MPFARPTLATLINRIQGDLNASLAGADSRLPLSALTILAFIFAGIVHGLYGFLEFIINQVFPDTAESTYLQRICSIWGITAGVATPSIGTWTAAGTNGTVVPINTILTSYANMVYQVTASASASAGNVTVPIQAVTPGSAGNAPSGLILTLVQPISGINSTGSASELSEGTDVAQGSVLLANLLQRLRNPPQGGSASDYEEWMGAISGVTRSWVTQESGAGSVTVRFMMDNTYSPGIPVSGDVSNAQAFINTKKPETATVYVLAPIASPVNFNIHLINSSGTTETSPTIQAAVQAQLAALILRECIPNGTLELTHIENAISLAAGVFDYTMSSPNADVVFSGGHIGVMGTITWS